MSPVKDRTHFAVADKKTGEHEQALTITELAFYVGASPQLIEEMVEVELVSPCSTEPELRFHTDTLPIFRKALRIHKSLGVSVSSLPLILDLLDRIEKLEEQLARLMTRRE